MAERMLVDWHAHTWLPEHFSPALLAELADRTGAGEAAPERLRAVMASVDRYVIVGSQWGAVGAQIPNDFIAAQVAASAGKAIGFASVNPTLPDAAAELVRAVEELGLRGLKISPAYQGFDPRDARVWPLYGLAVRYRIPVMVHAGGAYPAGATLEHANPILFDPVARAFPELRLIIAHLGQPWMAETVMLLRKHPRVYADLSARFHRPWQLYNGLILALEYRVEHKLLFGSDWPVRTPEESIALFRGLRRLTQGTSLPEIPERLIEEVLYARPLSLLGL